jgi:hypothetical protein
LILKNEGSKNPQYRQGIAGTMKEDKRFINPKKMMNIE